MRHQQILAAIGASIIHLLPQRAVACGGLWCTLSLPVNQAAENILFVYDKDDENPEQSNVTAVVQIMYEGPSESFAWLLPVPNEPDVSISSNAAFWNLISATDPQYVLNQSVEGECKTESIFRDGDVMASVMDEEDTMMKGPTDAVTVVKAESVGPYDYVLISVNTTVEDVGMTAVEWLQDNNYDVFDETADVLRPYLEEDMLLLAFRLTKGKDADTGSIRPVVLKYNSPMPMIPIRPTAVAANDDMGIRVWVTGEHRAFPTNYASLTLNEALINWFNWRSNYDDVVTAAANQADGKGFVTELAGPTSSYKNAIFSSSDQDWWESYPTMKFDNDAAAIQEASWRLRNWDGWVETVRDSITLSRGVTLDDFRMNPSLYQDQVDVNMTKFLHLLETNVIAPMRMTQDLFDQQRNVTRMYTTMSAEDMSEDPTFDINKELLPISNVHNADLTIHCDSDLFFWNAPWTISLPGGGEITGQDQVVWPFLIDDMPANSKVERIWSAGASEVIQDNSEDIMKVLSDGPINRPRTSGSPGRNLGSSYGTLLLVVSFWCIFL